MQLSALWCKLLIIVQGILSTDLYKLYINPLLYRLQDVGIGLKIGNINVNNTGCADDIALLSTQLSDAQIMGDPGRCVHEIHIRIDCMQYVLL
jgi:hypothetical protein